MFMPRLVQTPVYPVPTILWVVRSSWRMRALCSVVAGVGVLVLNTVVGYCLERLFPVRGTAHSWYRNPTIKLKIPGTFTACRRPGRMTSLSRRLCLCLITAPTSKWTDLTVFTVRRIRCTAFHGRSYLSELYPRQLLAQQSTRLNCSPAIHPAAVRIQPSYRVTRT